MLNHNAAFTGGSTFYFPFQIGQHLARQGHQVTVIASSAGRIASSRRRAVKGIDLWEAPAFVPARWRYGYDPGETLCRVIWVSRQKFDIVHAFESRPVVIYPALMAKRRGARLVMHWGDWFGRGGSVEQRANPVARALLRPVETYYEEAFRRCADATTVINTALEERALQLGVPAATIVRAPAVADPEMIRPLDRDNSRKALGLPMNVPILGYLGALFPADAALLVDAFARVRAVRPATMLVLIGKPKANIPAAPGLIHTGFVSYEDLNRYLCACDVLCLPLADSVANRGRYPAKLGDYFAAGRPAVACAVGDVGSVMQTARAGLLSLPTPESLAGQIVVLLDNMDLRRSFGQNARQAAETYYNWAFVAAQLESLYLRLVK